MWRHIATRALFVYRYDAPARGKETQHVMPPVVLSAASEGTNLFICYLILLATMGVSIIIIWMTDSDDDDNALPQDERVARGCMTCFSGAVLLVCVMFLFILGIWALDHYASKHNYNG
jgi:hypothetical protein